MYVYNDIIYVYRWFIYVPIAKLKCIINYITTIYTYPEEVKHTDI